MEEKLNNILISLANEKMYDDKNAILDVLELLNEEFDNIKINLKEQMKNYIDEEKIDNIDNLRKIFKEISELQTEIKQFNTFKTDKSYPNSIKIKETEKTLERINEIKLDSDLSYKKPYKIRIKEEAYDSAVNTFIHYVSETKKIAATPQYARDNIKEIENRKEFAKVFCSLYKQFKIIQSYIEYEFDEIKFGITEEEIADFKTVVSEWREEANETDPSGFFDTAEFDIINDLSFIEINATYIRKLIESIISIEAKSSKEKRAEEIRMQIKTSKNPFVIAQKDILLRGIDEALTCTTVEEYEKKLLKVIELMKNNDIKNFAEENKVSYNKMQELIDDLLINNNKNRISNFVEESLAERNSEQGIYKIKIKLKADIAKFLKMYRNKYIMCY